MAIKYYKVSGRFEVYDKDGILITDQLFINKIFEAPFFAAAKNIGLAYAKKRANKKYGKGSEIKQAGNLRIRISQNPPRKKKANKKPIPQPMLF